jgi:PAS domain S-box-containing protein
MADHIIHILLVEDNPGDAELIRQLLADTKGMRFQLESAATLAEAVAHLKANHIDLVLLDLGLPDSTGLDTLRSIDAAAPETAVVVVLSDLADGNTAMEAVVAGAQDYLVKGQVDNSILLRSIRYALGRGQAQDALRKAHAELEARVRARTADLLQANLALRESQHLLESLLDNLSTVIFVKDLEHRYIMINPAFERLFETTRDAVLGKTDEELFPRDAADWYQSCDQRAIDTKANVEVEELVPTSRGVRTFLTIKSPLLNAEEKPYAVVGIAADITERKQLEEQLRQSQKMEAVGRLAGGIAHDFNNLLSIISGYSELLGMSLAGQPAPLEQLAQISKAAEQAASLTRKLLTFSRRQMTQHKLLDLNAVIRELEGVIRSVVGENVEVAVQVGQKPSLIRSERDQIEQAILNLVLNARDAMPNGGKLTLATTRVTVDEHFAKLNQPLAPGPHVRLTIADTGCGMNADTRAHIFEPFYTTKEPGKGTGLGLSIVYGIVQQAGGAILVESKPNQGTSFSIYLPQMKGTAARDRKPAAAAAKRGSETILVVEDEEGIRDLLAEVLRLNGYTVMTARHGREALALAESHSGPIDLMITDLVMPQMGGRELAAAMKLARPETRILFISGYSERTTMPLPEGLDFMDKPFTPDALVRRLRQLLDTRPTKLTADG